MSNIISRTMRKIKYSIVGEPQLAELLNTIETEEGKQLVKILLSLQNELLVHLCFYKQLITAYIIAVVTEISKIKKSNNAKEKKVLENVNTNYKKIINPFLEKVIKEINKIEEKWIVSIILKETEAMYKDKINEIADEEITSIEEGEESPETIVEQLNTMKKEVDEPNMKNSSTESIQESSSTLALNRALRDLSKTDTTGHGNVQLMKIQTNISNLIGRTIKDLTMNKTNVNMLRTPELSSVIKKLSNPKVKTNLKLEKEAKAQIKRLVILFKELVIVLIQFVKKHDNLTDLLNGIKELITDVCAYSEKQAGISVIEKK